MKSLATALFSAFLAGLLPACLETTLDSLSWGAPDAQPDVAADLQPLPQCPELPDLAGRVFHVTSMEATSPTDALNEFFAREADEYRLVMLFRVSAHDRAAGKLRVEIGSAWADTSVVEDGTLAPAAFVPAASPAVVDMTLSGCDFSLSPAFALDLVTPSASRTVHIEIDEGHGRLAPDGSAITDCRLTGLLPEPGTFDLCIDVPGMGQVNFHWLMNLLHICADQDSDGEGSPDAYLFEGVVDAEDRTALFQPGLHEVEFTRQGCVTHQEQCR